MFSFFKKLREISPRHEWGPPFKFGPKGKIPPIFQKTQDHAIEGKKKKFSPRQEPDKPPIFPPQEKTPPGAFRDWWCLKRGGF